MNPIKKIMIASVMIILLPLCTLRAMSYDEERTMARDFINLLEANNLIVHDYEIEWPVQMVADRLSDHIKDPLYTFKIHIIKDATINAFTIPDGHIFVHVGLLLFIQDMDELSAVIGHEMGHAQMRHIPQDYQTDKKLSTAAILGVLAGTLLSTKNPEAGTAMILSSMGGSQNIRLAFSREHEYAADSFGKSINAASGVDPSGMARFLIRLNAFSGASGMPEYLLTHPFTENRIANMHDDPGRPRPDATYWTLYASVIGLTLPAGETTARSSQVPEPYKTLAVALAQTRVGNYAQARTMLDKIDLPVAKAYLGLNLYELGKKNEAYPLLKEYSRSARTKIALAELLQERGNIDEAINTLSPYQSQSVRVDYTLGTLYEKVKKPELSHVSYARYFFKTENYRASIYHIEEALKSKDKLSKETLAELKMMKDMMKKSQRNQE
ncbi:MAG TPA: M48 family metalloprotease [Desulfomonilia bacterium]|nr:M48 family metalloprotease [Desulfomonilia bacterium]